MVSCPLPLWCCPWSLSGKSAGKCARFACHLQNPQICCSTNQLYIRVRLLVVGEEDTNVVLGSLEYHSQRSWLGI